jgi:hypothetical protein
MRALHRGPRRRGQPHPHDLRCQHRYQHSIADQRVPESEPVRLVVDQRDVDTAPQTGQRSVLIQPGRGR